MVVSRSDSAAKRCGTQESTAMLASTRGPSVNPACAATTSSIASEKSVSTTSSVPERKTAGQPVDQDRVHRLARAGATCQSR